MNNTKREETEFERLRRLSYDFTVNINKCPNIKEAILAFRIAIGDSRFDPEPCHFHGGTSNKTEGIRRHIGLVAKATEIEGARLVLQVEH